MATQKPLKKTAGANKRKPSAKKASPAKRKVVAAKITKASAKKAKPAKRKVMAAKSKPVKSAVKVAAAKAPAKPVAKVATKAAAKSSAAFAKTNKPVVPLRPRPLSPHLSIYNPQITSVMSIMHRGTGVVLYIGAFLLAAFIASLAYGEGCFSCVTGAMNTTVGGVVLYGFLFCLFYHLCNGIRHLMWDVGQGFELCTVTLSGFFVLAVSLSLTFAVWFTQHPQFLEQVLSR